MPLAWGVETPDVGVKVLPADPDPNLLPFVMGQYTYRHDLKGHRSGW